MTARVAVVFLLLAGCATTVEWYDPESHAFREDNYACRVASTYQPVAVPLPRPRSGPYDSAGAGFARGLANGLNMRGPRLDDGMYIACMEARGHYRVTK